MKKLFLMMSVLILSSCFGGFSSPAQFYTLQSESPDKPVSAQKLLIAVETPDMPSYLDRPQMVLTNENSAEVTMLETHRWIEPLGKLFERSFMNDLYACLPNAIIKNRALSREKMDLNVAIQVNQLGGNLNDLVTLDVVWSISNKESKTLIQKRTILQDDAGKTYADFADAQSKLIGKLAYQIAEQLVKMKK